MLGLLETFEKPASLPMLTHGLIGSEYRDVFAFSVLVLVLIFRPAGLPRRGGHGRRNGLQA